MRLSCLILTVVISGCSKEPRQVPSWNDWAQPTMLDQVLTKTGYSNAIVQAEVDLPTDKWETNHFGPVNVSRSGREYAACKVMLDEIKPQLKNLSVTELVKSLKAVPFPEGMNTNGYDGVAGYVYFMGNEAIIREIKSRPTNELQVLRGLATDRIEVYRGPQGFMTLLEHIIKHEILGEKPNG